jgi:hypothetical protein
MTDIGIPPLYLPELTTTKPKEPWVHIYANSQSVLNKKKRVVVIINDHNQDLGIWAYRVVSAEDGGIDVGTCVGIAKELKRRYNTGDADKSDEEPGLIVMNPGQLLYSHKKNRSMSMTTWNDKSRKYAVCEAGHEADLIHEEHNHIKGNRSYEEHIHFVFKKIVEDPLWVATDAEIFLIGIQVGGNVALKYLSDNWTHYSRRLAAIALVSPFNGLPGLIDPFKTFLANRGRAWKVSTAPYNKVLDTPSYVPPEKPTEWQWPNEQPDEFTHARIPALCPEFSSEEHHYNEVVLIKARDTILDWFEDVAKNPLSFRNPDFDVVEWAEPDLEVLVPENPNLPAPAITESSGSGLEAETEQIAATVRHKNSGNVTARADDPGTVAESDVNAEGYGKEVENVVIGGIAIDKALLEGAGLLDETWMVEHNAAATDDVKSAGEEGRGMI